jgi:hypothetical protein
MVCISNCDKITPGMLMAALRLNVPAVFVSGGPMEAGKVVLKGKEVAVVIPVTTHMMLQRNLLYTGVTRGKRLVVLLGQKKAVAIAVKNVSGRRRWSKLREWLNPVSRRIV